MPHGRRFDAVLLDFGGVLTGSPFSLLRSKGDSTGLGFDEVMEIVMGPYDRDTDHPWHQVERGELKLDAALALIAEAAQKSGLDFEPSKLGSFFGTSGVHDVVVDAVRRWRADGYRTALVTNNVQEFSPFWRAMIPLGELFDEVVDSCEVGVRKPDPQIFRLALDRLGVSAERALFVDDWPGHVEAAQRLGITGVLMGQNPEAALAELDALLLA
jgi:epoxide hydrolase-like predicted phosphatase